MRWCLVLAGLVACGDPAPLEPTYENVRMVVERSCGTDSRSCHGGVRGNAQLNFRLVLDEGRPITDALVDVPSCEYDLYDRVEPGDPERSWLFIKLSGAHDDEGNLEFTPDPTWDPGIERRTDGTFPPSECPLVEDGELTFGQVMPENRGNPRPLRSREIQLFRDWILAGAPGPT